MMKLKKPFPTVKQTLTTGLTLISIGLSSTLYASYTELGREYNAVSLGDGGAGGAAIASDASTAFANPAGLVRIPNKELVVSADGLFTNVNFQGSNTWSNSALPFPPYTQTGPAHSNASALIPAIYYSMPVSRCWFIGLSVTGPFGLQTAYPNDSLLRYNSTDSWIKVIDISPNVAFKINQRFSVGGGIDFDRGSLVFRARAGIPTFPFVSPTTMDARSKNTADGWGYGWHLGALYQMTPCTRFGINYRSRVNLSLQGTSQLSGGFVTNLFDNPGGLVLDTFRGTFVLPATTTLSAYHDFNPCWAVDGTVHYTQWGSLPKYQTLNNIASTTATGGLQPLSVSLLQDLRDSWLFAVGGSYRPNRIVLLRAGISYDETPTGNSNRNIILPDPSRIGLSVGTHLQPWKTLSFDLGYTHLFGKTVTVNTPVVVGTQTSVATGTFHNHVDLVGGQLNWDIC